MNAIHTAFSPSEVEIPAEILRAWKDKSLVFFCGAGVSMPSALPSFKKLTRDLVKEICGVKIKASRTDPLVRAIWRSYKNRKYDEVLGMLATLDKNSGRLDRSLIGKRTEAIHHALKEALGNDASSPSRLHQLIIQASPQDNIRIITTNFDCLFEKELHKQEKLEVLNNKYCAPQLPIVRPKRWERGLIKLHGCVQGNYHDMVLTTASYGLAYFQDGWASAFLKELFQHYTVVFVGYSLNDVVIEYILHAYGALKQEEESANSDIEDKSNKLRLLRPAFIFLADDANPQLNVYQTARMEMMGVNVIGYAPDNNHAELLVKLEKLAGYCTHDPDVMKKAVYDLVTLPSVEKPVEEALKIWFHHDNYAIKYFCEKADIRWLSFIKNVLHDHIKQFIGPLPITELPLQQKPTWWVMEWFIRHHAQPEMLDYVLRAGGFLHPVMRRILGQCIAENKTLPLNMRRIWEVLLHPDMLYVPSHLDASYRLHTKILEMEQDAPLTLLLQEQLLQTFTPKIHLQLRRYERAREPEEDALLPNNLFQVSLTEQFDHGLLKLAEILKARTAWLCTLAPEVLGLVERMHRYIDITDDYKWRTYELEPLLQLVEACAEATVNDADWISETLRAQLGKLENNPVQIMSVDEIKPRATITEEDFDVAWKARDLGKLYSWMQAFEEREHQVFPANNVDQHLSTKLNIDTESYYAITEAFIEANLYSMLWWRLLMQAYVSGEQFQPDWARMAALSRANLERLGQDQAMCDRLCEIIRKSARGDHRCKVLDANIFWPWWQAVMPYAQAITLHETEQADISNIALNHPLGALSEALVSRIWEETDGKPKRINVPEWQARLNMLTTRSEGDKAAWVVLAGELPLLLQVLSEWSTKHLVSLFDWNNDSGAIQPIQAWSSFMYQPHLTKQVEGALLGFLVQGIARDHISLWNNRDNEVQENYIAVLASLWAGKKLDNPAQRMLVRKLGEIPAYAAFLISHWERGFRARNNKDVALDQEYLEHVLTLLCEHTDLLTPEAAPYAVGILLLLNENELQRYGCKLVDALQGKTYNSQQFPALSYGLGETNDGVFQPSDVAILRYPLLLLDLLYFLLIEGQSDIWVGHLKEITIHIESVAREKNLILDRNKIYSLQRKAES